MSNSSLVSYTKLSPNCEARRGNKRDMIVIHCVVGQVSVETLGNIFASPAKQASSNYGIGFDGRIAMYVKESQRAWSTGGVDAAGNVIRVNGISGADIDHRAITIECACDPQHPYAINDKVYKSLIKLCADICQRNGIKELKWHADKSLVGNVDRQNMAVHRWFANKSCPGDYIYNRLGQIASEVNALLGIVNAPDDNGSDDGDFLVQVDVTDLRIRTGPGTSYGINGCTGRGVVTIVETKNGPGSTKGWGKLKSGAGWISLDYAEKIGSLDPDDQTFRVRVDYDDLRIRTGPGTNYDANGFTGKGIFTIVEVRSGSGSTSGWGKLKSGAGWISLDYAEKV